MGKKMGIDPLMIDLVVIALKIGTTLSYQLEEDGGRNAQSIEFR